MTRRVAITNQKGGVGKTTTAINLAASLARTGSRVLLIDMDPQGNATVGSGLAMREIEHGIYEVLLGEISVFEGVIETGVGYDMLPSHPDLSGAQVEMSDLEERDYRLDRALTQLGDGYDIVLVDCPPALNVLTINALTAADEVLIPVQTEYYALEGLTSLIETIDLITQGLNPQLKILGLVRTMFDGRNTLSVEVSDQLKTHFPDKLFRTVIPRNVRLAEAPSYGKPVLDYDRQCAGSQSYLALASEVLRRTAPSIPGAGT
ncbi:MAG: AAA family ATPase [Gammaproteobacteria bacterium]|nr:AAA family ATPase [Gammaproteobacteria bacterium]